MKVFLYSSPYQYYADNLIPLARYFKEQGHAVFGSYRLSEDGSELSMFGGKANYSADFLKNKLKVDVVVLVQPWWYQDRAIVDQARKNKIPFFIIDHAPPMMKYTQADGKSSHLYRQDLRGARAFFAYGPATIEVMKSVGCRENLISAGSSRLENILKNQKQKQKGYVLFDTSNKMEDPKLVDLFLDFVKSHSNEEFILREHSRSPKHFRKALKYENVRLDDGPEEDLFRYQNFIFSFPSSAMLVPAILNRNIFALYHQHFCSEAVEYYQKYQKNIPILGEAGVKNYQKFIKSNLLINEIPTEVRIYQHIMENL